MKEKIMPFTKTENFNDLVSYLRNECLNKKSMFYYLLIMVRVKQDYLWLLRMQEKTR